MLQLLLCFSCCRNPQSAYKRTIRTAVSKRNEKLTEVANFDNMIDDIRGGPIKEQDEEQSENETEKTPLENGNKSVRIVESAPSVVANETIRVEQANNSALDKFTDSAESLTLDYFTSGNNNLKMNDNDEEEMDKIKEYARLDYTPVSDVETSSSDGDSTNADNNDNGQNNTSLLLSKIEETNLDDEDVDDNNKHIIEEPSFGKSHVNDFVQQVPRTIPKPPRPSTLNQHKHRDIASPCAALASPLSGSTNSLMSSLGSVSVQSHFGGRSSRMSWDATVNDNESLDDLLDSQQQQSQSDNSKVWQDGINYDHEFICSRLDEIFNQQMSLLNIDANQLTYENIAIIIAYDKSDPKNNNRLICFATSKTSNIRLSDDLNLTSMIDMRAATMARRALLSYLYKEIEIMNANNSASGKVLSQDAYLLERAYKLRQPAGYKLKNNIGLSMYLNRIEAPSVSQVSRSSSRASACRAFDRVSRDGDEHDADRASSPADQPPILRLKSIDHKISLWNVLGLQGSILGMMVEPIYLDHIILGQVEDLKRLKTLQSNCAKSSLSAHANKPYRLACPKLLLWRDDCQAVFKNISTKPTITTEIDIENITNEEELEQEEDNRNSLNWTYHDYLDDQAAELIEIKSGSVKAPYHKPDDGENSDISDQMAAGSRLCKAQMMQRLLRIMTNGVSCPFLHDGHNGARFFGNIEPGTRVTYRALKNLAFQYNYVKYLCSPIFMNDLRVAAGGIDWVNSYDKVKNYEDQINCKVPFSQSSQQFNLRTVDIITTDESVMKLATKNDGSPRLNRLVQPKEVTEERSRDKANVEAGAENEMELDIPDPVSTRPLRSRDNSLPDLSNRLFLVSQASTVSTAAETTASPTPTPSEMSGTKWKKRFAPKALFKKLKPGKKKKKASSEGQLDKVKQSI